MISYYKDTGGPRPRTVCLLTSPWLPRTWICISTETPTPLQSHNHILGTWQLLVDLFSIHGHVTTIHHIFLLETRAYFQLLEKMSIEDCCLHFMPAMFAL